MENKEKTYEDYMAEYSKSLDSLTEEERKQRDLYLKRLGPRPDVRELSEETIKKLSENIPEGKQIYGPTTNYPNIDKPWLWRYTDEAILASISGKTIWEIFLDSPVSDDEVLINYFGVKITKGKIKEEALKIASALEKSGINEGDHISINSVTIPQGVYILLAASKIGAILNTADVRSDSETMKHYINEGKSKITFTLADFYPKIESIIEETASEKVVFLEATDELPGILRFLAGLQDRAGKTKEEKEKLKQAIRYKKEKLKNDKRITSYKDFVKKGLDKVSRTVGYKPEKVAAVVHTSGSTDKPKSAALTNENFEAAVLEYQYAGFDFEKGDSLLNIIPMFTSYGIVNSLMMPIALGMVDIVYPKIVEKDFMDIIRKYKPQHIIATPMHYQYMLEALRDDDDLSFIKTLACGGDRLKPELEEKINEALAKHGARNSKGEPLKIVSGYGATELSGSAITNSNTNVAEGTNGAPLPGNNITFVNGETGLPVQIGEYGKVKVESRTTMKEYLNNDTATRSSITESESGLRSFMPGDSATMDALGNVLDIHRDKRVIIRKGFKMSESSIEEVVYSSGIVSECGVIRLEYKSLGEGEYPIAYICLNNSEISDEQAIDLIKNACENNLPEFYLPIEFMIVSELPHTSNGKIDYQELKKTAVSTIKPIDSVEEHVEKFFQNKLKK